MLEFPNANIAMMAEQAPALVAVTVYVTDQSSEGGWSRHQPW